MGKLLWKPTREQIQNSEMTHFIKFVNSRYDLSIEDYFQLHKWSITNIGDFWATLWKFTDIIASHEYEKAVIDSDKFFDVEWFPGARLNFAENLLRHRDNRLAFIFRGETEQRKEMSHLELYNKVARLATSLRNLGVKKGDFVAAYQPNLIETIIAMLAATSIGATWASCGAELGPTAVLDRLGQIKPKILFTADGYYYKGRIIDSLRNTEKIVKGLPSIEKVLITQYISKKEPNINKIPRSEHLNHFMAPQNKSKIIFEQLPFNHPIYVMFSSGTTGKPKSMVQGAGGVLLSQLRDLILHTDLKRSDRLVYVTSPSWMMWNWSLAALTVATVVLYDGNPLYPDWGAMWKIIDEEEISIFGTSASYLHYLHGIGAKPKDKYDLSSLRIISQTASAISAEVNEWMYTAIKENFHFNSITGGSDLNAIFAGGCSLLPVHAGEIQVRALGMKIEAYNEAGKPVRDQQAELVCENPSPSMPLYFWDDPNHQRYKKAYFEFFKPPNKNVWRHGDYVVIHSDTGGMTVFGRSDAVLKPSGVRIGTSEIYNIVETFPEIADSLAIGQSWKNDQRVILFVKLSPNYSLTDKLKEKIKQELRVKASPRHVPSIILETPEIPYTFSMKKVEMAVSNIIHRKPVTNRDALSNPESLNYFEKIRSQLSD